MKLFDKLLDCISMYRLVVYTLLLYILLAIVFAFDGRLSFRPSQVVVSVVLVLVPAYITDRGLARAFRVPTNSETWLITGLIMCLILQPAHSLLTGFGLVAAAILSSASKFLLAWHNKHIFNPAALAAAFVSLTSLGATTWWIGNSLFWPVTLLLGLIIVRKIRRVPMLVMFVSVTIVLQLVMFVAQGHPLLAGMRGALTASPLIFLTTLMLTEPATMPSRRRQQLIFAALVAALYVIAPHFGPLIVYPEAALLIGNIFAFVVSPKLRLRLRLQEIQHISDSVYNYIFVPEKAFAFMPGQHMEWTIPGAAFDSRGNRRTLTIASSPTEDKVQLGLKYHQRASAYKMGFASLSPGDPIYASQLAGDFTLDAAPTDKLVFVAGGIGVTPFRSMVKYLSDTGTQRDVLVLYVVPDDSDLAYLAEFNEASLVGVRLTPIVTRTASTRPGAINSKLTMQLLSQLVPDASERTFYISGPSAMVDGVKGYLRTMSIPRGQIKTDYFSGY
ncbi:MAG: hypothetical protein ABIV43_02230 [Candidatus Saccharimonadales bacterium]